MGLLTSTENKCFQRWKHGVHDKQTSTEKHTMACTRKSLRLDRATLGGTPSCIQGGAPCYTQGVNLPTVEVVLQLELSAFTCRTDEAIVTSSQNRKHCNSGALIHPPDRRNKALPVSAPARRGKSLQTPSLQTPSWLSVRHLDFACSKKKLAKTRESSPSVRIKVWKYPEFASVLSYSVLLYIFSYHKYIFCIIGTDDNTII